MTDQERVNLVALVGEVREMRGEVHGQLGGIDRRIDALEKRLHAGEGNEDALRHEVIKLRSALEALPCGRHHEQMAEHTRRISELVRAVRAGETTDQIEVAKLEAERRTRDRIQRETARRWQVYAAVAAVVSTAAGLGIFRLIAG